MALKSVSERRIHIRGICDGQMKKSDVIDSIARNSHAKEGLQGKIHTIIISTRSEPLVFNLYQIKENASMSVPDTIGRYSRKCTPVYKVGMNR